MTEKRKQLIDEIRQLREQYIEEVGRGGRKPWPKSIQSRIIELCRSGLGAGELSELTGVPYHSVLPWRRDEASSKFGLKKQDIEKINSVIKSFPEVEAIVLYGSRAMGNYKPGSDIDLTLKGHDLNANLISKIATKLDDLLLPYMIDLSAFNEIDNPSLIEHIERVGLEFK